MSEVISRFSFLFLAKYSQTCIKQTSVKRLPCQITKDRQDPKIISLITVKLICIKQSPQSIKQS